MPAAKGAKKAPKSHKLAEKFPAGEVLRDLCKKEWVLSDVIGQGGFGLIYLATEKGVNKPEYVVKIEPFGNGPLFCEVNFYQRVAKPDIIDAWVTAGKLKYLGVPKYIASGQHTYNHTQYRFMVMQRFGQDLQSIFEGAGKKFETRTVFSLALRLIDALEYLHGNNFAHADVKASNCLVGFNAGKVDMDKIYLVDYGLATKFAPDGVHKSYKEDPRKAHDGTVEFTSRDAHNGVGPSRRADMEILGYCLLQWLCGKLPWEDKLADKNYVSDSKHKYMKDISLLMKKCFPQSKAPDEIVKYLNSVKDLRYDEEPNYQLLRDIFVKGLAHMGVKDSWKLYLPVGGAGKAAASPKKPAQKRVRKTAAGKSPRPGTPKTPKTTEGVGTSKVPTLPGTSKTATPKRGKGTPLANGKAAAKTGAGASLASPKPIGRKRVASPNKDVGGKVTPVQKKAKATVKSPAAAKAARVGLAAISSTASPGAPKRARSPAAKAPEPKRRKVNRRKNVQLAETAVQTSPGLKKNS